MAPGVRSGRTGHPELVVVGAGGGGEEPGGGGRSPRRTDAGGEGRCLRTRWRAGAAGMLANCLLSVGMLSLLVRCALAEDKPTYDASGSSSLQSDPAATAAPAHPLADLSVAEEVPFSVVHSDGDSESEGEGLSGQPAFSSVLTVMAGTVKHPVSLDQSRTSPTITRDETHTTQWPSHSSSSEMSSSLSSAGDRILPSSSGLTSYMSHQHTTPPQAVTMALTVSRPPHSSFMAGNGDVSSSIASSSLSPSMSPSISFVLSSFSSTGWINKAVSSSSSQRIVSSPIPQTKPATLSPAQSLGWADSLTTTQYTTNSAVIQGLQSTTTKPSHFPSETSLEKSNKVTTHSLQSPVDKINGVSGTYIRSASTKVIKKLASRTYTSYSTPNHGQNLLNILYRPTQTKNLGMNSILANNLEISTSFPTNQESQAVQRQQGALQNPTSALLSAHPKGYSVSSHVPQQMLNQTAYAEKENKTAVDIQTFVHKSTGDTIMLPLSLHVVNPTAKTASFFTVSSWTPPGKMSLSESAITKLTPIHSGTVSSEHASNPGDLPMAAGHDSSRVLAININYNQGEIAEAELKSISSQAHLNNSLSPTQPRPESTTTGSILSSITRTGTTSSTSGSDSLYLPSNGAINIQRFLTGSPKGVTQEPTGWLTPRMIIPSNSRTMSLSGSALPVRLAKDITYKTTHPTYLLPLFLSHSPNHNTDHNSVLSANSEINFADQAKALLSSHITPSQRPFQTRSLLTFPHKFYTTSGLNPPPNQSHQTVSSAEIFAHIINSERVSHNIPSTSAVETSAGNDKTSSASDGKMSAGSFHRNAAKSSVSPLFDRDDKSTLIRDTAFNKKGVLLGQFTTQFPSFKTTKDSFVVKKGSEGSGKGSPSEIPFSPAPFDAALETLKSLSRKDDKTLAGHYEQPSTSSSWPEIIGAPRTNSVSHSQGPITSVRSDKSTFHLGTQTTIPSTASYASSAATTSSSDGQSSTETFRTIFSFGTKIMALYTKWKTTKPVSFQSTASKLENTSIGFDRENSNLQADGPSYEHPKLEDGQERNVHLLNSTDPTVVASYPTVGEYPSFTYVKGTSGDKDGLNLPPANHRSAVQEAATVHTAAPSGSEGFLPLSHLTAHSVTSSQASSLALVYKSKHRVPQADVDSLESKFDTATTLSNNPALHLSKTINIKTDPKGLTLQTEQVPSSLSAETSPLLYSIKASQLSSLSMKPPTSMSSQASLSSLSLSSSTLHSGTILSVQPTMYPDTASSTMSVPATFPSSSPSPTSSIDSEEVTEMFDPKVGEHTSLKYVKSTSRDKEQTLNLFPANLRSAMATVNTAALSARDGSDGFLPHTDSVTSSQALSLVLAYKSNHSHPLADVDSLEFKFDTAAILSNNSALSFFETISNTTDLRGLTRPTELVPLSSSSETSLLSYSGIKASLPMKLPTTMSPKALSSSLSSSSSTSHSDMTLSIKPTLYPGNASSSVSVKVVPATLQSLSSTSLTSSINSEEVTERFDPTVGEHSSFTYAKGTPGDKEQTLNLSPANLRSAITTVNTVAPLTGDGSDGFLPLSIITTRTVTSSQASSLALVYKSKHSLPLADVDSLESKFYSAATRSNNPALSFSETINNTTDSRGLTRLVELVPSSSSSSETSPMSYPIKASQLSSLYKKSPTSMSSQVSSSISSSSSSTLHSGAILSIKPTMYPDAVSLSMSTPATFPSSSPSLSSSIASEEVTETFVVLTETGMDELTAGTSRAVALTFPKEKVASLAPSQSVRITLSAGPTERTSQVSPLPPGQDTTTASVKLTTTTVASATKTKSPTMTTPSLRVTTATMQSTTTTTTTTTQPTPETKRTTTTTTIRTQTSRRTFTPPVPRMSPPRGATTIFISPFTTTTEAPPQQCNITERLWVKTVVSIYVRRNRLDSIQRQNLRRGLSQGLRKALNDSSAQAQVETVFGSPNMTVAYHVTGGDIVYPPSVVLEGLDSYGRDKLIADLRQYLPMVTALPLPVALWRPSPATGLQLKTVLQFVGAGDDPRSCRFSQMMEQRLEKVFSEAQAKVLNINSRLSVQMLSVSQAAASPAVSLVYTVKNGTVFLNGTTASNLLGQLSAELVGYFLFYPPLIIAEPMEYHNLNTSIATKDFWVITVIQDVDNASLEGQYQSFASLMEQRLAELFVLAGQQGTRFRRATTVGSYTVQMVSIRRVSGMKNPAEMTYYVQHNGVPLSGTSAAKVLNTVDSQTMALTLGYFVQLQAEPVVKNPPNNLWIIAAVLAPIAVVTLIIIIITAVLCRKNKNDFKADAIGNLNPRAKMAYRRDVGYYHQPVQGFDYAKQHLGQQGGDEETLPVSQDTLVMSLQIRDAPLSLEKALQQDGTANKKSLTSDKHKSKLPSEDGSVISNESEKLNSGRGLTVLKVTAQQKLTKEETRKRDDPYDTSSGSLQLISIKPMAAQPNYSHPASSDRSQDSAIVNGEVNLALKQKSDIEHYRNKLRLKAKRKGYYDFPSTDGSSSGPALAQRQRHGNERAAGEHGRPLEPDDERGSTYVKSHRRHSQVGQTAYRSRQSLSSPSPGGTEMDLLVMRERPRRGIRNSGYDTEPELIEETNVDRLMGPRGYMYGRGLKGHSETSTLSSQPSIDEVRQQMHLLLEEAFSLASGGQSTSGRHSHHHHPPPDHYSNAPPPLPYADVVTSAPGTMSCGRGGLQWVPSYGSDVYQCSLPKPAFHFTQLPEMAMGSPPPLPPRTGPPPGTSLRRSTSDLGPKGRSSETSVTELQSQHDNNPYGPTTRAALPSITAEQPVSNYSGNPITAVYAIPATRPGYSEYFVSTPPTSYHSPSWMSYPPEPEDVPPQWADSGHQKTVKVVECSKNTWNIPQLPLPGYVEAFPHPRYPQGSPTRLPLQYNAALEQPPAAPSTASQQSLPQVVKDMDSMPLSSLSTSALVQAIRQEVAKLAKKQNDVFEF